MEIRTKITNRADAKLMFDFVAIQGLDGVALAANVEGGGRSDPVGAIQSFIPEGIEPKHSVSWQGFIVVKYDSASGRCKPVSIVYAFRFIDQPDTQHETPVTLILR